MKAIADVIDIKLRLHPILLIAASFTLNACLLDVLRRRVAFSFKGHCLLTGWFTKRPVCDDCPRVLRLPHLFVNSALLKHAIADLLILHRGAVTGHLVLIQPRQVSLVEEGDAETVGLLRISGGMSLLHLLV